MNTIRFHGLMIEIPSNWTGKRKGDELLIHVIDEGGLIGSAEPMHTVYLQVHVPSGETLDDWVAAVMKRRLQYAGPLVSHSFFLGLPARECDWVDGVSDVISWFFAYENSFYEVQRSEPLIDDAAGAVLNRQTQEICRHGFVLERQAVL